MSRCVIILRVSAVLLVFGLPGVRFVQASGSRLWSVELRRYGYRDWRNNRGLVESSELGLAVANTVVAVAVGNPSNEALTDERADRAKWEITLLLFDPATGKLSSKRGPWTGDRFFEMFSTSQGNLLLHVRHFDSAEGEKGEVLYLLSPTGEELKKLFLPPSILQSKPSWSSFLVSTSGRSVLMEQTLEDGEHYKLLDADTLDTKCEWAAKFGVNSRRVVALSDHELLGVGASRTPANGSGAEREAELFAGAFGGAWSPLHASLDARHHGFGMNLNSNLLAFLTDDTLVGLNANRKASEAPIMVLRTDGSKVFNPVIPRLPANTSLSGPVYVSQNGRYFAVGFTHRPWLSHLMLDVWQLDDTFQDDELELAIWASSSPTAVAQVNLGSDVDVLGFSPTLDDPPSLVFLDGATLKAIRIHLRR
jgi:hypothetical protein